MNTRPIALVTGGSKGIGAATAVRLAQDGLDIWLNYRSDDQAASRVKEQIEAAGGTCRLLRFNVTDLGGAGQALEPLLETSTPFAVVNNAGFAKDTLMMWMTDAEWKGVLSVHLDGFFNITKLVLSGMLRKREGRIVNIVSTSGQTGVAGQVNYSTAKAGLIGATRSLAAEIAKRNILVNAVSPGFIETEMTAALPKKQIVPNIPMKRFGTAEEVAHVVSFLCSPSASYITGQVIAVNGGVHM
jgi:3-oxoacyl-[acyl-carrier protein] reductase